MRSSSKNVTPGSVARPQLGALRASDSGGIRGSVTSSQAKRYLGTQRVARVCQVSPATVANWIDQGHLKGHRTPTGRRRVEAADLVGFLKGHEMAVAVRPRGGM